MHRFTPVWSAVLLVAMAQASLAGGARHSQPQPDPQSAEKKTTQQGAPKPAGRKTDQPLPFEDPAKATADVPTAGDTDYLSTLDRKTMIGEVNGQPVLLEDLYRLIDFADEKFKPDLATDAAKRELLNNYLESRAFYFEALSKKMDQDPDLSGRLELFRQQLLANAYRAREIQAISVDEAEMRKYYEERKKDFEVPESITASHILVKTEEEALEIKARLDKGEDFAAVARERSLDTTNKSTGGRLGVIARGAMQPEFDQAAFALKAGQVSAPVHTTFGYEIIKVTEVRPRRVRPFDEAKSTIEARVIARKQADWQKNKREELRSKYNVKIYDKYFSAPSTKSGAADTQRQP